MALQMVKEKSYSKTLKECIKKERELYGYSLMDLPKGKSKKQGRKHMLIKIMIVILACLIAQSCYMGGTVVKNQSGTTLKVLDYSMENNSSIIVDAFELEEITEQYEYRRIDGGIGVTGNSTVTINITFEE